MAHRIMATTKNMTPFLTSPASAWPNPGMKKDRTAARIAFTMFVPPCLLIVLYFFH